MESVLSPPLTFMWVPGIELRFSGLLNKSLSPLIYLVSLRETFKRREH